MKKDKDKSGIAEIGCLEAINGLYAYLDGEMKDPKSIAEFEHHLEHCKACYSRTELENCRAKRVQSVSGVASMAPFRRPLPEE